MQFTFTQDEVAIIAASLRKQPYEAVVGILQSMQSQLDVMKAKETAASNVVPMEAKTEAS